MRHITCIVRDVNGLHAQPATTIAELNHKFSCNVYLEYNGVTIDAGNVFHVLALDIKQGAKLSFTIEGVDEDAAFDCLTEVVKDL